jgi:hypothetical protein
MHKTGTDRPDESLLLNYSVGKSHKHVPARGTEPDAQVSRLVRRVCRIWKHPQRSSAEYTFNLFDRDAMLEALIAVPVIPIEPGNCLRHRGRLASVCTNVHTEYFAVLRDIFEDARKRPMGLVDLELIQGRPTTATLFGGYSWGHF